MSKNQRFNSNANQAKNTNRPSSSAAANVAAIEQPKNSNQLPWGLILGILLITFFVFYPSLKNQFVNWDDEVNLLENNNTELLDMAHVKAIFKDRVIGNYNPLPILTLAIERHFVGIKPENAFLYHFDNLLLHLLCTFFVFLIARAMNLSNLGAAIVALLFGIHPMRVESVAWVTERKDVLLGAFYLPALYNYILSVKNPERRGYYITWTVVLFAFALLAKIQAVSLPLSCLAVDYYFKYSKEKFASIFDYIKSYTSKEIFTYALLFGMSVAVGLAGIYFLAENKSISLDDTITDYGATGRLCIGAYSFCVYLMKLFIPYEMSPLYPYPQYLDYTFYLAWIGVVATAALGYWAFKYDKKALFFGLIFFFLNIVFLLQILGAGQGFLADRFTYIAYLGLFFIIGWAYDYLAKEYPQHKTTFLGLLGAAFLGYAALSFKQCKIWENGEALWSHVIKYYPNTDMPWGNRANYLRGKGDYKRALEYYKRAEEIRPQKAEIQNSLGKTFFDYPNSTTKEVQTAINYYSKGIQFDPNIGEIYINRAAAYGRMSMETNNRALLQNALQDIEMGKKLIASSQKEEKESVIVNGYLNGYLVHDQLNMTNEALADVEAYIKLRPNESDMYYSRGLLKRKLNKEQEALQDLDIAVRLGSDNPQNMGVFYYERAKIHAKLGNKAQGLSDVQQAQRLGLTVEPALIQTLQ